MEDHEGKINGGSSSEKKNKGGSLKITLRVRLSSSGENPAAEKTKPAEEAGLKICGVCGKGFRNDKALRGHMRVHANGDRNGRGGDDKSWPSTASEKSRLPDDQLNDLKKYSSSRSNDIGDEIPVCRVCGRVFRSMKALSGHMRCHPERDWRGIKPPLTRDHSAATKAKATKSTNRYGPRNYFDGSSPRSDDMRMSSSPPPPPPPPSYDLVSAGRPTKVKSTGEAIYHDQSKGKRKERDYKFSPSDSLFFDHSVQIRASRDLMELSQYSTVLPFEEISIGRVQRRRIDEFDDEYTREMRRRRRGKRALMLLNSKKAEWDSDDEYWLRDCLPDGWDHDEYSPNDHDHGSTSSRDEEGGDDQEESTDQDEPEPWGGEDSPMTKGPKGPLGVDLNELVISSDDDESEDHDVTDNIESSASYACTFHVSIV